jgi:hypothetical protein
VRRGTGTNEFPAEQYVRDVEIATIYEGTNGIQAMDFAGRTLLLREGAAVRELLEMVGATSSSLTDDPRPGGAAKALGAARGPAPGIRRALPRRVRIARRAALRSARWLKVDSTTNATTFSLGLAPVRLRHSSVLRLLRAVE